MLLSHKVVMRAFVPFSFSGRLPHLPFRVCACSCRHVYKPQVGSRSLLISWEPAEWDSIHFRHPLNVSDWICLLAKLQKEKKKSTTTRGYIYQTYLCSSDVRLGLLQMHMSI